ncbi:MAG TPA: glycoside hydrolase family 3 N-terminal domain-containing protein [Candidatus Sulfopaludibacter sp.]|nr:glycoside hydrolase family 3 N-terminal domain-containing protein [Candidatus Sulfopaludibacter sp.]
MAEIAEKAWCGRARGSGEFRLVLTLLLLLGVTGQAAARKPAHREPPAPPLKGSATVRRWLRGMTLRDEVAQLVFIPFHGAAPNTRTREYRTFLRLVRETKVGGLVLVNVANGRLVAHAEPYALATFLNRMQRLTTVPLMVGGDFERGASMRVDGTTVFPHAMAFGATGDPSYSKYEGEVTAREARALGVQWVYYPVADVNNNPDNPIINIRSFGENPQMVAAHVRAFIEGAHADKNYYVMTTAKHFPGHGDTAVDTHVNMATVTADRAHLESTELVPFRAAIEAGVDAIMTAHSAVPALAPADQPATLSPAILTDLLRRDLGFKGLVVTDALDMGGIAKGFTSGEAAVRALEAGADTLLMPADPDAAIKAVMAAVEDGRLTRQRIRESVVKILAAKEKMGLARRRFVDTEAISDVVDSPEANEKAQEIADRAVTLVRNGGSMIPLAAPERTCFVVLSEGRYSTGGQVFSQEVRKRARQATVVTLDPTMAPSEVDAAVTRLAPCESYAVAAYVSVVAARETEGLTGALPHAIESLTATGKPVALIAMGNPYLLRSFANAKAYLATFSTVQPSERAAVRALWGEIPIRGHLPVSIPNVAAYGEGIQTQATRTPPASGVQ